MSNLDLKLINEFKMVPEFYNRKCERFKDKAFVNRAWNNISIKLGYNVNNLKDRMYQLRNRYNLEKRKLQAMKDEGILNPKPVWPLFHNLNFLSSHIKQRKSYKMMSSLNQQYGFRGFTEEEGKSALRRSYMINRNVDREIKHESSDMDEAEYESDDDNKQNVNGEQQQNHLNKTSQTLKNINILKRSLLEDNCSDGPSQRKIAKTHHSSDKFVAFGSFVSSSLQDLEDHKALVMIDRFTSEIVRALITSSVDSSAS